MKGLTLLLKSLGIEIDPEDLKKKAAEVVATIQHFDSQVTEMNAKLTNIELRLTELENEVRQTNLEVGSHGNHNSGPTATA